MLTKTKNLGQAFELLKIMLDLDKTVTNDSILGFAIRNAIQQKRPATAVLDMIKSQAEDNIEAVKEIVTEPILKRILCTKY